MPKDYVEPGTLTENFDGIRLNADGKTIDQSNPNYPEGWTINLSSAGSQDVYTTEGDYCSAPLSLCFDAEGDEVVSPETPAPITSFSFWVKPSSMDYETDYTYSLLQVSVYTEKKGWTPVANMPNYYMEAAGGRYSFTHDQIGDGVKRIKFFFIQKNSVSFALDDVQMDYATQTVPVGQLDKELTDTCYTMEIDPNYEYYYNVRAKNGSVMSVATPDMWVDGILGVKVEAKEATDVSKTAFTANWTELHNADKYKLNVIKILEAKEDVKDVVVLHEDSMPSTKERWTIPTILTPMSIIWPTSATRRRSGSSSCPTLWKEWQERSRPMCGWDWLAWSLLPRSTSPVMVEPSMSMSRLTTLMLATRSL